MTTSQDPKKTPAADGAKKPTGNAATNSQSQSVKSTAQKAAQTSTPAKKAPQKQASVKSDSSVKQSAGGSTNKKDSSSSSQHIADKIKSFARRRVWPD